MTDTRQDENQREDDHFGLCPVCRKPGVYMNVYKNHWMLCEEHKTRWWIGSNLFSSWTHETTEDWERNREMLQGYQVVEPFTWPRRGLPTAPVGNAAELSDMPW